MKKILPLAKSGEMGYSECARTPCDIVHLRLCAAGIQICGGKLTMNKVELIAAVAEKAGLSKKDAEKAIAAVVSSVEEALIKGDKVQLIGFGTFEGRERAARVGRNPQTKEEIKIAASKQPVFKAGAALKKAIN